MSKFVAIVLVVSLSVSLGVPSTENCNLVGSKPNAPIASILPASLLDMDPIKISALPLVGAIREIMADP